MLLTGSYRRALDDKQRLAIPKNLREQLAPGEAIYLTPGLDGCLAVYPKAAFAALADRLAAGSPAAREVRSYSRLFYSQAACVVPDSQWRFRLPPELMKWAELASDVIVVGVRDHIEVWATEKWQSYIAQCDGHYERLAESALEDPGPPHEPTATEIASRSAYNPVDSFADALGSRSPR